MTHYRNKTKCYTHCSTKCSPTSVNVDDLVKLTFLDGVVFSNNEVTKSFYTKYLVKCLRRLQANSNEEIKERVLNKIFNLDIKDIDKIINELSIYDIHSFMLLSQRTSDHNIIGKIILKCTNAGMELSVYTNQIKDIISDKKELEDYIVKNYIYDNITIKCLVYVFTELVLDLDGIKGIIKANNPSMLEKLIPDGV